MTHLAETIYSEPDVTLIDARDQMSLLEQQLAAVHNSAVMVILAETPPAELLTQIGAAGADILLMPLREDELLARITLAYERIIIQRRQQQAHAQLSREHGALQREIAELRRQVDQAQAIVDHLPIGMQVASSTGQIMAVNPAFCRFIGYSAEELIGRQAGFMVVFDDHAAVMVQGQQLAGGQIDSFTQARRRYVHKDGSVMVAKLRTFALRDSSGHLEGFLAFVDDIDAQVLMEDQLARYTHYQQALADLSLHLVGIAADTTTRTNLLKQVLQRLIDGARTSRAYLFQNVDDSQVGPAMALLAEAWDAGRRSLIRNPTDHNAPLPYAMLPQAHCERLLAGFPSGGLPEELYAATPELIRSMHAEGVRSTQMVPLRVDGKLWGFMGFDECGYDRKWDHVDFMLLNSAASLIGQTLHRWQIEDNLRAIGRLLHTTGNLARVGGWRFDVDTRKLTVSEEFAALLEVEPAAISDFAALLSFCAPEARHKLQAATQYAIRSGASWDLELPFITARGRWIWLNSQGQVEAEQGRNVRLFGAAQDVTRRKAAELQLERQLRIEAGLTKYSQELLETVRSFEELQHVVQLALEHLRLALDVDQATLMMMVADQDDPYLTLVAIASPPTSVQPFEHPLARRFPLSLLPPSQRNALISGTLLIGLPDRSEMVTPEQHAWLDHDHSQSRISLPVLVGGELWGVLGFNSFAPREWGAQEQSVLRTASEMCSHVIRRWRIAEKLRHSEEQFRSAVETMLDGFAILDSVRDNDGIIRDFRFRFINEVGAQLNQRPREQHLNHTLLELLPAHHGSAIFADYVNLVESGRPMTRESVFYDDVLGSGERLARVLDVRAVRLGDGIAVAWRDVTDLRLAHESLTQANGDLLRRVNELRTLNMIAQTLAFTQDLPTALRTVCRALAARTGAERVVVAAFERYFEPGMEDLPAEDGSRIGVLSINRDELGANLTPLLDQRRPILVSLRGNDPPIPSEVIQRLGLNGATELLLVPLKSANGNLGVLALGSSRAESPFNNDDQSLVETMAGQIATAIDNARLAKQAQQAVRLAERNRVARELHDSATQSLYSLSLMAGGWALQAEQGRLEQIPAKFNQLNGIALQVLKELRLLIYELRHPELAEGGLVKTLEDRLEAVEQRANVRTTLTVSGDLSGLPPEHEEHIFALIQEALNNALRHAQARNVAVTMTATADQAVFRVQDDGIGFDPSLSSNGLGLRGMHERSGCVAGRLTLSSEPGRGTLIELTLPFTTAGETRDV